VTVQAEILDLLRQLRDETGTAIVLITHNMGVVADLADRLAVMYRRDLAEVSSVERLFSDPKEEHTRELLAAVPRVGSPVAGGRKAAGESSAGAASAPRAEVRESLVPARDRDIVYPGRVGRADFHAVQKVSFHIGA